MKDFIRRAIRWLAWRGFFNWIPDKAYLKMIYWAKLGKKLHLDNPTTFSEKLQWLKLYHRESRFTDMVDKYKVKEYVSKIIGEEYVLPLLGVYDSVDDVNIDELPDQFILKCTNDSGTFAICKDKNTFDFDNYKSKFREGLKRNYYYSDREWPYKNVEPRIIAEPYLDSLGREESLEFKFTCADGKLCFGTICHGIAHAKLSQRFNDSYDKDFNLMPWYAFYKMSDNPLTEKPKHYDKMVELAEKLSEGIPSVRVDFYVHNDQIYFGEFTFYTWGGFLQFTPDEWDKKLSKYIKLPNEE